MARSQKLGLENVDVSKWRPCQPEVGLWYHRLLRRAERLMALHADRRDELTQGQLLIEGAAYPRRVKEMHACLDELRILTEAYEPIPAPIRTRLLPFGASQLRIARFVFDLGEFERKRYLELIDSTPAIAFMIANHLSARSHGDAIIQIGMKQRDILAGFGFSSLNKRAINILRKIPQEEISVEMLRLLRELCSDSEVVKLLSYLSRVNRQILELLSDLSLRPYCSHKLLGELSLSKHENSAVPKMFIEVLRMSSRFGVPQEKIKLRSLRELRDRYRDLKNTSRQATAILGNDSWICPSPPFEGAKGIVPLATIADIIEECERRDLPFAHLAARVVQGGLYFYRVMARHEERFAYTEAIADIGGYETFVIHVTEISNIGQIFTRRLSRGCLTNKTPPKNSQTTSGSAPGYPPNHRRHLRTESPPSSKFPGRRSTFGALAQRSKHLPQFADRRPHSVVLADHHQQHCVELRWGEFPRVTEGILVT